MMNSKLLKLYKITCCNNLSTTIVSAANRQEKNIINKMVFGKSKVKKKWYLDSTKEHLQSSTVNTIKLNKEPAKEINRRISILNKLFMKNITDLMATGSHSDKILGKQIEVSQVKVTQDFQCVNVFWLAKGDDDDLEIQTVLNEAAISIRHELSQLRLMGEVPKIYFVKDKQYAKIIEIENLIKRADLENYPENENEIDEKECSLAEYDCLPMMKHDLFGLNHEEIMNKITTGMQKTKQAWDKYNYGGKILDNKTIQVGNPLEANEEFRKYLERQQIKKRQRIKNENNFYELNDREDSPSMTNEPADYIEEPNDSK